MIDSATPSSPVSETLDEILSGSMIDAERLEEFFTSPPPDDNQRHLAQHKAARKQVERLSGRDLASLSTADLELASESLQILLGREEKVSLGGLSASERRAKAEQAKESLARLDRLRLGQPDPEMMFSLSPRASEAVSFLEGHFRQRQPVVRLIAGDMGEGKTTLARSIQKAAVDQECIPLMFVMPRSRSLDTSAWLREMVLDETLLTHAIQQIAQTTLVMGSFHQVAFDRCFSVPPLSTLMHLVIELAVIHCEHFSVTENAAELANDIQIALSPWLAGSGMSRITPGKEFIRDYQGGNPVFSGYFHKGDIPRVLADFLSFYREAGVYPIWLFDEFESIAGLNPDRKQEALGFFRSAVDLVSEVGNGALFIFTTGDGLSSIRQYPALEDRLKAPGGWTLTSPSWSTRDLSTWEAKTVLVEFLRFYRDGATAFDPTSEAVVRHESMFVDLFGKEFMQDMVSDCHTVPRERLKAIVGLFDTALEGRDALEDVIASLEPPVDVEEDSSDTLHLLPYLQHGETDTPDPAELVDSEAFAHDIAKTPSEERLGSLGDLFDETSVTHFTQSDEGRLFDDTGIDDLEEVRDFRDFMSGYADIEPQEIDGSTETEPANPFPRDAPVLTEIDPDTRQDTSSVKLTPFGMLRKARRELIRDAVMPFLVNPSYATLRGIEDHYKELMVASSYVHFSHRLARLRDAGGTAREFWDWAGQEHHQLTKKVTLTLLEDEIKMEERGRQFLDVAGISGSEILVVTTETDAEKEERKSAEARNHEEIGLAKTRGESPWPFIRDKVRWSGCRKPALINPMADVRVFRKVLYAWFCCHNEVPSDEWVDRFTLETLKARYNYTPRTSRDGVQFIMPRGKLLGRFDRRRTIAVEPVSEPLVV